jgi:hypothetical protein
MALEVEDGTGKNNAESYASVSSADTYVADYLGGDTTWDAATTTAKEVALRQATQYIDGVFGPRFNGDRASATQALAWPRMEVWTPDGEYVSATVVPTEVEQATIELAVRAAAGSIQPDETALSIKSERVKAGPVETETEYNGSQSTASYYPKAARLLWRYMRARGDVARG